MDIHEETFRIEHHTMLWFNLAFIHLATFLEAAFLGVIDTTTFIELYCTLGSAPGLLIYWSQLLSHVVTKLSSCYHAEVKRPNRVCAGVCGYAFTWQDFTLQVHGRGPRRGRSMAARSQARQRGKWTTSNKYVCVFCSWHESYTTRFRPHQYKSMWRQ